MQVIEHLVKGKNDSELLEAMVHALSDNEEDLIEKLRKATDFRSKAIANVEVVAAIVQAVRNRLSSVSYAQSEDVGEHRHI